MTPTIGSQGRNFNALEVICRQSFDETQVTNKPIDSREAREGGGRNSKEFLHRVTAKRSNEIPP